MQIYEAVETEYKGIKFRSKSEAMFAFMLDSHGCEWVYEPEWLKVGTYIPDFFVIYRQDNGFHPIVIEYKPTTPTKTYLEKLTTSVDSIGRKLDNGPFKSKTFRVVAMDFFSSFDFTSWSYSPGKWEKKHRGGFKFEEVDFLNAKRYRYDLVDQQ